MSDQSAKLAEALAVIDALLALLGDMPCCLDELLGPELWARVCALRPEDFE